MLEELTKYELKTLPHIEDNILFEDLLKKTDLKDIELMRALQWLSNKNLVIIDEKIEQKIILGKNGLIYKEKGLPEKRLLKLISSSSKTLSELIKLGLSKEEINISIGLLKKKLAINLLKDSELKLEITSVGKSLLDKESLEEKFLKLEFPLSLESLSPEIKFAFESLQKRKDIVILDTKKIFRITLTELGKKLKKELSKSNKSNVEIQDSLTSEIIKKGNFDNIKFRHYDVESKVPQLIGGRRHPLSLIIEKIREIFIEMGFSEMEGPLVESAFWCLDSMWIPQDHPARDVQDTFYLPYEGVLPKKEIVSKVKEAHEFGMSNSKGYGYAWDKNKAKQLLLRTHTTATTYRNFYEKNISKLNSAKYFYVGRVFRNETIDATHLPEFHQVEGFVMGENLNIRHLMGFIKNFYSKMGIEKIKFKITYNPYTESSLEALYYDEKRNSWLELINSGIFRPEALAPFGINKQVVAWGLGVERLAMTLYKLDKLKDLLGHTCDLDWLRSYNIL